MGSAVPSNAAAPQQELTGPQQDAPVAFALSTPCSTRRAAAPYFSRTVAASASAAAAGADSADSSPQQLGPQHPFASLRAGSSVVSDWIVGRVDMGASMIKN